MGDGLVIELLIRGAAVGGFLGLAAAIAGRGRSPARLTAALFCLAAAAHTLTQSADIRAVLGWLWVPAVALSVAGAGLFWALAMELFEDRRRLDPVRFAPAAALLVLGAAALASPPEIARWLWLAHHVLAGAAIAHCLFVIANGWKGDLVEARRRLRGPILAAAALYALGDTAVEIAGIFWLPASALAPLAAVLLFALSLASVAAFLQADPDLFGTVREAAARQAVQSEDPLDGKDAVVAAALDRLMRVDRLYREPGLTIAVLALKLQMPEHKLRQLINQRLGYRNFNAFLNHWRLDDVKQALSDPGQREVPIATVAFDAGFQSLGPFNRAFKAETGLTPSEYRAQPSGAGVPKPAA